MGRKIMGALVGMAALTGVGLAVKEKGEPTPVLTGEVVDTSCWMKAGMRGDMHKECAKKCGEMGIPLGVLVTKGGKDTLYLALAVQEGETGNALLLPHVARQVKVTGKILKKGGCQAVVIEKVEAAAGE